MQRLRTSAGQRAVAGALLAVLGFRYALRGPAAAELFSIAAALALGGSFWWVAKRQSGPGGAAAALALYVCTPAVLRPGAAAFGALGLFAMVYTGVGVAHALQGPRRKRPPRILLMAGLTCFTAALAPGACAAGLLLALAAALYLAEGKRGILPVLFAGWSGLAAVVWFAVQRLHLFPLSESQTFTGSLPSYAGLLAAFFAALALWGTARRTRYFGNTAPLLAALLLLTLTGFLGAEAGVWALPFALLFAAGCFADALQFSSRRVWVPGFVLLAALQFFASL